VDSGSWKEGQSVINEIKCNAGRITFCTTQSPRATPTYWLNNHAQVRYSTATLNLVLSNMALSYTSQLNYLGHLLTSELRDDNDILKQVRSLYAIANMLLRKFRSTQLHTKVMMFNAFCSPIYSCQLWCHFRKDSFNRLRVANNRAVDSRLDSRLDANDSSSLYYIEVYCSTADRLPIIGMMKYGSNLVI